MHALQNMADFKDFGKKAKSGMYGEMPKVKLGKFTIAMMSDKENEVRVWIENEEGEGGEFKGVRLEGLISKFFDANF